MRLTRERVANFLKALSTPGTTVLASSAAARVIASVIYQRRHGDTEFAKARTARGAPARPALYYSLRLCDRPGPGNRQPPPPSRRPYTRPLPTLTTSTQSQPITPRGSEAVVPACRARRWSRHSVTGSMWPSCHASAASPPRRPRGHRGSRPYVRTTGKPRHAALRPRGGAAGHTRLRGTDGVARPRRRGPRRPVAPGVGGGAGPRPSPSEVGLRHHEAFPVLGPLAARGPKAERGGQVTLVRTRCGRRLRVRCAPLRC